MSAVFGEAVIGGVATVDACDCEFERLGSVWSLVVDERGAGIVCVGKVALDGAF